MTPFKCEVCLQFVEPRVQLDLFTDETSGLNFTVRVCPKCGAKRYDKADELPLCVACGRPTPCACGGCQHENERITLSGRIECEDCGEHLGDEGEMP